PNPEAKPGGSCEPGVIMVSYDANGNGLADDPWYEIAGSEYGHPQTIKNYELTYYRPDPEKKPVTDASQPHYSDLEYIRWSDNQGNTGYLGKNVFHSQPYFPEWIEGDKYTLRGTRLPDNGVDESGSGNYFVLYAFDYGYADNHLNTTDLSNIKIDWAVNSDGTPVKLPGVDFIRIHTGVHQQNGWLGECSTEILGVTDLHPSVEATLPLIERNNRFVFYPNPCDGLLTVESEEPALALLLNISGQPLARYQLISGKNRLDLTHLPQGMYLLQSGDAIEKLWIRK
ncbi:MAG: T9SS type A sorting domain-containing protein, partial [Bacteroidales bacterium]